MMISQNDRNFHPCPFYLPSRIVTFGPAWSAFFGSLLLSSLAVLLSVGPNRDGMLYIDTARVFLEKGLTATFANYNWPFFSIGIAFFSKVTGVGLEIAGYVVCSMLLAIACSLIVLITHLQFPDSAWSSCFVALSLPAINNYRDHIIREFGFYLFCLLTFWFVLKWKKRFGWLQAGAVHLAILSASLFRPEALFLYPSLLLWQAISLKGEKRLSQVALLTGPLLVLIFLGSVCYFLEPTEMGGPIGGFWSAIDLLKILENFDAAANKMAGSILNPYSADEAYSILFFGLLSILVIKFLKTTGIFIVPLVYLTAQHPLRDTLHRWQPLMWSSLIYVFILIFFLINRFFLQTRFVSFLGLLLAPLIATGLNLMMKRFTQWRFLTALILLIMALCNVISLGPKKTQFPAAGQWLATNVDNRQRVYNESPRSAYHAGWPYEDTIRLLRNVKNEDIVQEVKKGSYDLIVLEKGREDLNDRDWTSSLKLREVIRFVNRAGDTVIILAPQQ